MPPILAGDLSRWLKLCGICNCHHLVRSMLGLCKPYHLEVRMFWTWIGTPLLSFVPPTRMSLKPEIPCFGICEMWIANEQWYVQQHWVSFHSQDLHCITQHWPSLSGGTYWWHLNFICLLGCDYRSQFWCLQSFLWVRSSPNLHFYWTPQPQV